MRAIDIKGKRFGRLVAIQRRGSRGGKSFWRFLCDCGNRKEINKGHVMAGRVRSCGCLLNEVLHSVEHAAQCAEASRKPRKHGMKGTPVYNVWKSMHQRCSNPKSKDYKHYGAKGVTVCERWRDFSNFYADMGDPNGLTLDRRSPVGNYEPGNCRWATWSEQNLNKRRARGQS